MNKKYLKENGLYDAHKQFMKLCEWSYSPSGLDEDDDNPQDQMSDGFGQGMGMEQGQDQSMNGGNQQMQNGMGDMSQGQDMMGGDPMGQTQDPNQDAFGGGDPMGGMGDMSDGDFDFGEDTDGEDEAEEDDVIDVDDLTNAQEKMNKKINHVGKDVSSLDDRIGQLMSALDNMENMINSTNSKIEQLNTEFQNRVKSPTEKLNLRSLDSYPFSVKPTEYWDKLAKENPNYSVKSDNDDEEKEYTITQDDVDNVSDSEIAKSFDLIDDDMRQDINKIFGL